MKNIKKLKEKGYKIREDLNTEKYNLMQKYYLTMKQVKAKKERILP